MTDTPTDYTAIKTLADSANLDYDLQRWSKDRALVVAALPGLIAKARERDEAVYAAANWEALCGGMEAELASLRTERDAAIREVAEQGRITGQAQAEADALRTLLDEAREVVRPFADIRNVSGRVEHHIRARSFLAKLGEKT